MHTYMLMSNTIAINKNDSDDFFQSKHLNKRREQHLKEIEIKEKVLLKREEKTSYMLINGLKKIRIALNDESWKDEKEKLFLNLFSKFRVSDAIWRNEYVRGYYLINESSIKECICDLNNDYFWINYESIWYAFEIRFYETSYCKTQLFMNDMLKKYFNLYDMTAYTHIHSHL